MAAQLLGFPGMAETAEITRVDGVPIIRIKGKITLGQSCTKLRQAAEQLLEDGENRILLDMEEVVYVDSAGLGAIASSHVKAKSTGGSLGLFGVAPAVQELLVLTRLNEKISIFIDQKAALAGNGSDPAEG